MASNDPSDTGGLFVGRRPGTAPLKYRDTPTTGDRKRRKMDGVIANGILVLETILCITLWGPQPAGWLWVGSQVDYLTGSVMTGILVAFAGMLLTLFFTLAIVKRLDHAWRLVRRAAGYEQKDGVLERIFVIGLGISATAFLFWLFILHGPGSSVFSGQSA
ncbi:MAG: hypothetical protein H0V29_13280 [Thermoleophilaceae bacterium]|nr:hypothetical protein [Thermoleophilaceae bacterium]